MEAYTQRLSAVAYAQEEERAAFIRRTYMHLAGAVAVGVLDLVVVVVVLDQAHREDAAGRVLHGGQEVDVQAAGDARRHRPGGREADVVAAHHLQALADGVVQQERRALVREDLGHAERRRRVGDELVRQAGAGPHADFDGVAAADAAVVGHGEAEAERGRWTSPRSSPDRATPPRRRR